MSKDIKNDYINLSLSESNGIFDLDDFESMPPMLSTIASIIRYSINVEADTTILAFDIISDFCDAFMSKNGKEVKRESIPSRLWTPICNRIMLLSGIKVSLKNEISQHGVISCKMGGVNYKVCVEAIPKDDGGPILSMKVSPTAELEHASIATPSKNKHGIIAVHGRGVESGSVNQDNVDEMIDNLSPIFTIADEAVKEHLAKTILIEQENGDTIEMPIEMPIEEYENKYGELKMSRLKCDKYNNKKEFPPSVDEATKKDLHVDHYMSDYNDPDRKWFHVGGDVEASYDGSMYVDFRHLSTGERLMFASKTLLENSLKLFSDPVRDQTTEEFTEIVKDETEQNVTHIQTMISEDDKK